MNTLKQFSEKDRDYHVSQARQNVLRDQLSRQCELDRELQVKKASQGAELDTTLVQSAARAHSSMTLEANHQG